MYPRTFPIILVIATGMTGFFGNLTPPVQMGQQQIRKLKTRKWDKEPIKIAAVTNKHGRNIPLESGQLDDDDWLRGLTITIKNISKKDILFAELELHFLRPEGSPDDTVTAFPLVLGTPPGLVKQTPSPVLLPPGKNWYVSLSDQDYAKICQLLADTGYVASITDVEIVTREVVFADQTKWSEGSTHEAFKKNQPQDQAQRVKKKPMALSFSKSHCPASLR